MVYAEFGGQTECIMGNSKHPPPVGGLVFRSILALIWTIAYPQGTNQKIVVLVF